MIRVINLGCVTMKESFTKLHTRNSNNCPYNNCNFYSLMMRVETTLQQLVVLYTGQTSSGTLLLLIPLILR